MRRKGGARAVARELLGEGSYGRGRRRDAGLGGALGEWAGLLESGRGATDLTKILAVPAP